MAQGDAFDPDKDDVTGWADRGWIEPDESSRGRSDRTRGVDDVATVPTESDAAKVGSGDTKDGSSVIRDPDATKDSDADGTDHTRPAQFTGARRRTLLWESGYLAVSGMVLLVLWAAGRAIENAPDVAALAGGIVVLVWAGILVGIAAGGVGRTPTALVGVINILVGVAGFTVGWFNESVPVTAMVLAAQIAAFGVAQLVASVRK